MLPTLLWWSLMGAGCSALPTLKGMPVATAFLQMLWSGVAGCSTREELLRKLQYRLFSSTDDAALNVVVCCMLANSACSTCFELSLCLEKQTEAQGLTCSETSVLPTCLLLAFQKLSCTSKAQSAHHILFIMILSDIISANTLP